MSTYLKEEVYVCVCGKLEENTQTLNNCFCFFFLNNFLKILDKNLQQNIALLLDVKFFGLWNGIFPTLALNGMFLVDINTKRSSILTKPFSSFCDQEKNSRTLSHFSQSPKMVLSVRKDICWWSLTCQILLCYPE